MIAGKIIPAIATTTALIVGFNGMEIFKTLACVDFSKMRNYFCNMAMNYHMATEVNAVLKNKDTKPGEIHPVM